MPAPGWNSLRAACIPWCYAETCSRILCISCGVPGQHVSLISRICCLQEASDTAHDAAEAVLQPQTSAAFYGEQAGAGSQAQPLGGSAAAAQQAQSIAEDDRFLSLARGEAQADATDVGAPPADPLTAAHTVPAAQEQQPGAVVEGGPSTHHQYPSDLPRESQQGQDGRAGNQAPEQDVSSKSVEVPPAGYAGDDEASVGKLG